MQQVFEYLETLYNKLKWSRLADLYRYIRFPSRRHAVRNERKFLAKLICPNSLIFDIGANCGSKTSIFLKLKARKVIAVEPSPDSLKILYHRFHNNRRVQIVDKAVDCDGLSKEFYISSGNDAYNTLASKWVDVLRDDNKTRFDRLILFNKSMRIATVTIDELIFKFGTPDVIKIDVEGYELQVIRGLSKSVRLLWFEANLPEFKDESKECVNLLAEISSHFTFNYLIHTMENATADWQFDQWVDASVMIRELQTTKHRFMEIFAHNEIIKSA